MSKDLQLFITNEDLKDHIHGIHNFIRNNGLGYGKKALEIFSVLYGLKLIEHKVNTLNLNEKDKTKIKFSNLMACAVAREKNDRIGIPTTQYIDEIIKIINDNMTNNKELYKYLLYDVPTSKKGLKELVWINLLKLIDKIPVGYEDGRVNLSGKVYEYFIGRDQTAISELGAYFTDRHITEFIFNKLNPKMTGKNVPTMIDPFGGSGGFTLGYVSHFRKTYSDINWEKNINSIYHCDMESSVVHMTGLEMFALTNYFPKTESNTFINTNTFTWEFSNDKTNKPMQWDYVVSNPPYGGDKTTKNAEQIKRDKLIEYIKAIKPDDRTEKLSDQLKDLVKQSNEYKKDQEKHQVKLDNCSKRIKNFAKAHSIDTANDKEACSLILLMDMLAPGGTCCGVLKEGVFFDGKYSKLRQVLIENFNVTHVISVPQNAFENTSTKTSIVIFQANGKTKKINFSELVVELEEADVIEIGPDGFVHMVTNKDEIKQVIEKPICTATYAQLAEPTIIKSKGKKVEERERFDYSLNYKNYKDYKVICPDGYELKKLGDLCDFKRGERIDKDIQIYDIKKDDFDIPVFGAGNIQGYTNKYNREGHNCILSRVGGINSKNCCKHSYDKLYLSDAAFTMEVNSSNNTLKTYLYNYMLNFYDNIFTSQGSGSVQVTISAETLKNIQIPVPKDISKLKTQLNALSKLHQEISQTTEAIPQKEQAICSLIKKLTDGGKEGTDYDTHKLGDVCEIQDGYEFKNNELNGSYNDIPLIRASYIKNKELVTFIRENKKYEKFIVKKGDIIFSQVGDVGAVCIYNRNNFGYNKRNAFRIRSSNIKYVYYYFLSDPFKNQLKGNGTIVQFISIPELNNIPIKVLKPAIMKKHKLQELFDEVDKLKETLEANKIQYQNLMDKLFDKFTDSDAGSESKTKQTANQEELSDGSDDESDAGSADESDSDTEPETEEIEIKGKAYILEGTKVYVKTKKGTKGEQYGTYSNGKVKKLPAPKEIEV